jgi:hypothetical protein
VRGPGWSFDTAESNGSFQGTQSFDVDTKVIGNSVFADVGALRNPRR